MTDKIRRGEALSGIVFVALILGGVIGAGGGAPDSSASASKVVSYYSSHQAQTRVAACLVVLGLIVGLYFLNVVRTYLAHSEEGRRFANLGMMGAVLFAASGAITGGMELVMADVPTKLNPSVMQGLNVIQNDASWAFGAAGVGLMLFAYAMAIFRTQLMPSWTGWFSVVLGVLAVLSTPIGLGSPIGGLWSLVVSVVLFQRLPASSSAPAAPVSTALHGT